MKKVIIFGTGGYGLYALNSLDEIEYQVLCFVDNVKEFQGQTFYGYYVDAPENVFMYDFDYIILPVSAYAEQMRQQLSPPPARIRKIWCRLINLSNFIPTQRVLSGMSFG